MSLSTTAAAYSPPPSATQSQSHPNGNDFQFNFPKFGDLPDSFLSNGSITKTTSPLQTGQRSASASSISPPGVIRKPSSSTSSIRSPSSFNGLYSTPLGQSRPTQVSNNGFSNSYDGLDGLFSPSVMESAKADYLPYTTSRGASTPSTTKQGSVGSVSGHAQRPTFQNSSSASIGSPTSSTSHGGLDSSCGTTPESSADSPDNRKLSEAALNTVNEVDKTSTNGNEILLMVPLYRI